MKPRVAVLVFPGTNSEEETVDACRDAGMDARAILWSEPPHDLRDYHGYVIPGGFAYEDRVRAGAIAAKSPSVAVVREQAERGKLVLGLCNGAQVLAEVGLLGPVAIARNLPSGHFQCRIVDVELAAPGQRCAFTAGMVPGTTMKMAMAHGEGDQGAAIAAAVLPAVRGLDEERARFYGDLVLNSLNEAARRALETMMKGYEYQSDFAKKYVAQGEALGEAKASARALLTVLRARGIAVPDGARERILGQKDPERLERWLEKAAVAASIAEVLDDPS